MTRFAIRPVSDVFLVKNEDFPGATEKKEDFTGGNEEKASLGFGQKKKEVLSRLDISSEFPF